MTEENKFQRGLIYEMRCLDEAVTDFYIGSTISLCKRLEKHKQYCTTHPHQRLYKKINETGGWSNWKCNTIKLFPCNSRNELEREERENILNLKSTLNQLLPAPTKTEISLRMKQHRLDHLEKYKEKDRVYHLKNKEKRLAKNKKYKAENSEWLKEERKKTILCKDCNKMVNFYDRKKHYNTQLHLNNIKTD